MSPVTLPLAGDACRVRPWSLDDLEPLVRHANNKRVSMQLRDVFPFPYGVDDGRRFLAAATAEVPPTALAIEVDGEAAGGVGIIPGSGNERRTAEIGYWLGEACWGRGIGPEAVRLMRQYSVETFDLVRLQAFVITTNTRSRRTLEKAGFVLEGHMRKSFLKDGVLHDQCCYGWVAA